MYILPNNIIIIKYMQKLLFLFLLPLMPFSFPCHAQTTYRMVIRLCDGLKGVGADEVDTIVIAGMGGQTIIHILSQAPWTKMPGKYTLLLQPMTKGGELRRWLADNGYCFTAERLVWDKDFLYPIMVVTGGRQELSEIQQEYGVCLADDPLYGDFLDRQIAKLQRAAAGKSHSEKDEVRAEAQQLLQRCRILEKMREEWKR